MGAIAFSTRPEETWAVAGWALRQALDDAASQHPDDSEMAEEFEAAKAIDGLMVHLLRPDLGARVTNAIREIATGILSGTIRSGIVDQPYGDERTVLQYKKGLRTFSKPFLLTGSADCHRTRTSGDSIQNWRWRSGCRVPVRTGP